MTLEGRIEEIIQSSGAAEVGVAAVDPASGDAIERNADLALHPASTVKTCVMMEAYRRAAAGDLSLDQGVIIRNAFHSLADGSPYAVTPEDDGDKSLYSLLGQTIPMRRLIELMVTVSSNLGTNLLLDMLGPETVTAFMRGLGAGGIAIRRGMEDKRAFDLGLNNAATPRSLAHLYYLLARGEVVSPAASRGMAEVLLRQRHRRGLPSALPESARVAHKPGWLADLFHDAGIVYPPAGPPFVLAVMTRGLAVNSGAPELVGAIARAVYDAWRPSS